MVGGSLGLLLAAGGSGEAGDGILLQGCAWGLRFGRLAAECMQAWVRGRLAFTSVLAVPLFRGWQVGAASTVFYA